MRSRVKEAGPEDSGFGIVEVLVAMLMLALIAVAFLPVLITGLRLSSGNSSIVTAAQIARTQVALARRAATCAAVTAFAAATPASVSDGTGTNLVPTRTAGSCPSSYPGTISFSTSVSASGSSVVLASATTLIYVASGS